MKNELGGNIMTKFVTLRQKMCNYVTDDDCANMTVQKTQKNV